MTCVPAPWREIPSVCLGTVRGGIFERLKTEALSVPTASYTSLHLPAPTFLQGVLFSSVWGSDHSREED